MSRPRPARPPRPGSSYRPSLDWSWAARGACASHPDPDLWFGGSDEPGIPDETPVAICRTCPVRQQCLDYALSVPGLDGIWAGTTKTTRSRLQKQIARQGRVTPR